MDVTREKSEVFGQIAALRVSSQGFPKFSISNSIESISQKANSLDFLVDLSKSLIGFDALKETLIDVLTHNLDEIELDIKQALKKALKQLVSCSINPSLPSSFVNDGITLELSNIDLLDMFKVDPTTEAGKLLYNDISTGTNSSDFNTFLYNVIQNGSTGFWGNQTTNNDIFEIKFTQVALTSLLPNNTLNIKPSLAYRNAKLTDINNDYIDSIQLFETNKLMNNIVESIFGTISFNVSKNKRTIETEIKIQEIIDKIINTDEDVIIDDSYFQFSNDEMSHIEHKAEMRRKGMIVVTTCGDAESTINFNTLSQVNSQLDSLYNEPNTPELIEIKTTIVRNALDLLANESAENVANEDKLNIKLNFIEKMLKNIMNSIMNVVLSPKLIGILALNHSIIYGTPFTSVEDFMSKNKVLVNALLQSIRDYVISLLMARILKEIKILMADNIIKTQIERVSYKKAQLASLVGAKTDALRNFSGAQSDRLKNVSGNIPRI